MPAAHSEVLRYTWAFDARSEVGLLTPRIRFVTYNIRKGKGASGRSKAGVGELGQALATERPDVVLCQEVFHGYTSAVSQSSELGELLELLPYYEPNKERRVGHHGNATFTNLPVRRIHNYDVSTNRIERRGVLYLRTDIGGQPLHVFNAHLGLNQWQRLTQARRIGELVRQLCRREEPVVLAGDFNDWNGRLDKVITDELGLRNAFAHLPPMLVNTWHARRPVFNLDRVYLRHLRVVHAERLVGNPWQELSDHLPLWAELEVG